KPCIWRKLLWLRQQAALTDKEWPQRGEIERKSAIDGVVRQAVQGDNAEQLPCPDVMPVQNREQRTVVAVVRVAQHATDEAHVCELSQSVGRAIAFIEHIAGLDENAELRGSADALGDG